MRRMIMAGLMAWQGLCSAAHAQQASESEPPIPAALEAQPSGAPPGLTDAIIKKAVRETVAEDAHPAAGANREAGALSATSTQAIMSAAFEQAKVPDCLHDDALKHQPAKIGPIGVAGPFSLPWVIAAALRGKCL